MTDKTDHSASFRRVSPLQRALEERVANPVLRRLLQSRLHWLFSRWFVLVSYEGRRTGQRYVFPVLYKRRDGGVVAVTPKQETRWWSNFVRPYRCGIWLRGTERPAVGELVTGERRDTLLTDYLETYAFVGRFFRGPDATEPQSDAFERLADTLAVVRFKLGE